MNWLPIVWGRGILWGLVDSDFRSKNSSLGRNYFLGSVLFCLQNSRFWRCACVVVLSLPLAVGSQPSGTKKG
jgi:hypothetical protein